MSGAPGQVPFLDLGKLHDDLPVPLEEVVAPVLRANRFVGGAPLEEFEQQWAQYCGTRHAVGVGNGTDALELALRALGVGIGEEVLVPANTFVATPEAVVAVGAIPVFVDVDEETLLMDLVDAEAAVSERTAAVIAVHLFGQPVDAVAYERFARRHSLALVEDAAQAHGARFADGRRAGSVGDAACFSFYPGKNLGAIGDGGAVVTNDPWLAESVRSIADHGRSVLSRDLHEVVGVNTRLDTLQAAVLSAKLQRLDDWNQRRRQLSGILDEELVPTRVVPVQMAPDVDSARHLYVVRTTDRDRLAEDLGARGIGTGIHYPVPCHRQPAFRSFADRPLPVAERAAGEILSLPMSPTLSDGDVLHVAACVAACAPPVMADPGVRR